MSQEIANKTQKQTFIKCKKCGDEIFGDTKKKMTYCKCKKIWVDGCEDYIRIGGDEKDYKITIKNMNSDLT